MVRIHACRVATLVVLWSGFAAALLFPGSAGDGLADDSVARAPTVSEEITTDQLTAERLVQLIVLYVASGSGSDPPPPPDPGPGNKTTDGKIDDPGNPGDPGDPGDPPVTPTNHHPEPATLVTGAIGAGLLLLSRWRRRQMV